MNATREGALFALALKKPMAECAAFLDRECAGDAGLRFSRTGATLVSGGDDSSVR